MAQALLVIDGDITEGSDDDLVMRWRAGGVEALEILLSRYRGMVNARARRYFLAGADFDDTEQEGMIGLFKAVRDFRPERQSSFGAFAQLCVNRQIMTAVTRAGRHKHLPLNQYVSFSPANGDSAAGTGKFLDDQLRGRSHPDPAEELVSRERVEAIRRSMATELSSLEIDVLCRHIEGWSQPEIGQKLGRQAKSIENAIQRARRKLHHHLGPDQDSARCSAMA